MWIKSYLDWESSDNNTEQPTVISTWERHAQYFPRFLPGRFINNDDTNKARAIWTRGILNYNVRIDSDHISLSSLFKMAFYSKIT